MLRLDGAPLSIGDVVAVARDGVPVEVAPGARERMRAAQELVASAHREDSVMYGVTTGFGALADRAIGAGDRVLLQESLVRSHAAGAGPPLDAEVVRAMMLLRARTLCAGYSGAATHTVESIVAALNVGLVPWVPEHGSLGASGDLAPLAHVAGCLRGEGWAVTASGEREAAAEALARLGLEPLRIGVKDGLALINGTDGMAGALALAVHDLRTLLDAADCVAAMSVEALFGTVTAFDEAVVALRPSPGQRESAATLRAMLQGSPMVASHRASHHAVQDAYSLRCTPQVHGAARDVAGFARQTVVRELGSVVDNPVILAERGEVVSAGNFHGQALSYAADMCASVCADVASISERRVDRMLDPARSRGLPAFLTPNPGLFSGLMIAQYTAASLVVSLRHAAMPYAVESVATSAGQEDHVSMGWSAAVRTRRSVELLRQVLAVELLCAAQALELRAPLRPAAATARVLAWLRETVATLREDRPLAGDIQSAAALVARTDWGALAAPAVPA